MKTTLLAAGLSVLLLAGCFEQQIASGPAPQDPGPNAIGYICQMNLTEHSGPKGQIFLRGEDTKPLWFSSVRQVFDYMGMDGENHAVSAIYVNDMGRSTDWEKPTAWVEAQQAVYVVGSGRTAQMGGDELVPFSDRAMAQAFAKEHGGRVLAWAEVPKDQPTTQQTHGGHEQGGQGHGH